MSTSVNDTAIGKRKFRQAYVPTTALAKSVKFDEDSMQVLLMDGRVIGVPILWFPLLHEATLERREHYEIGGDGVSLHWPEIDEDLSVASLLAGADLQSA